MVDYETWKRQLRNFTEEHIIDFEQINQSFRDIYNDSNIPHEADMQLDLNFIVDSLEDEHVRRAVHTTKTMEEIHNQQSGYNGIDMSKAVQIAALFRKRGRKSS